MTVLDTHDDVDIDDNSGLVWVRESAMTSTLMHVLLHPWCMLYCDPYLSARSLCWTQHGDRTGIDENAGLGIGENHSCHFCTSSKLCHASWFLLWSMRADLLVGLKVLF